MPNPSISRNDDQISSRKEVTISIAVADEGKELAISLNHSAIDMPPEWSERPWQILHRVPPHVRVNKNHLYEPAVVALGPYHHGRQPQFNEAEEFKTEVLKIIMLNSKVDEGFIQREFLERVNKIRGFYGGGGGGGGLPTDDDDSLANMLLRDTCFILFWIQIVDLGKEHVALRRIGLSRCVFVFHDVWMLENQIPFWAIMLLISLIHDDDSQGEALLCKYFSQMLADKKPDFGYTVTQFPWKLDQEPLHLLEAFRLILLNKKQEGMSYTKGGYWCSRLGSKIFKCCCRRKRRNKKHRRDHPFRSVTDLKAKGVQFGPSSPCLKDIRFDSYWFHAKLQLPVYFIGNVTKVFLTNMMAFEMSPDTRTDFAMISYVNFMQSLIESPKDVKELREKGILCSFMNNDEQIMNTFKQLDTYGVENYTIFEDVHKRIDEHCDSKAKTWMAELVHTYFRNPWTAMALFTGAILLCLTFLQTFYTINPRT